MTEQWQSTRPTISRGRLWRLCRKELRETLRDRRTIVTLVLMPLLVYPLLSMALNRFLLNSGAPSEQGYVIGVQTEAEGMQFAAWLEDPRSRPPDEVLAASGGELAQFNIVITGETAPVDALQQNAIDVGAIVRLDDAAAASKVELIAFRGDSASQAARRILVERLQWLRLAKAEAALAASESAQKPPLEVQIEDIGELEQSSMLGTIVPLMLVLMTITGAVYPAIDLTAGERERGTMESLMASPVPRSALLTAKYLAVVTVALLTAVANLLAMFVTLWASGLLSMLTGETNSFPWLAIVQILGLLVLFSGFFSALLLCLTSFARSFKEAQAYLIPVMLFSLAPAMLSLMPGVKMSGPLAIAPLINIILLARDVLSDTVQPAAALIAILSTTAYAAAALGVASKLFGTDAVTRTSEQSIGSLFRRPPRVSLVPTAQAAALMLALLVPVHFIVSNGLMRLVTSMNAASEADGSVESNPVAGRWEIYLLNAFALVITFGGVPLIATLLGRSRIKSTFRIQRPAIGMLAGAFLLGLGTWAIPYEALVLSQQLGLAGIDEATLERHAKLLESWQDLPVWLLLGTLALAPAVIEELCFRGYLFSAFSRVLTPLRTIVVTSVLFGLFHVVIANAIFVERFIPTTLVGLVLGWVAWRTGSVLPGMLMHFVHNALIELAGRYHEQLGFLGEAVEGSQHLPLSWIAIATAIALAGASVVTWSTRRP